MLLFTSIFAVTLISKMPGGSPVLGFLIGGAAVGPYMLGLIGHVEQAKVLAEFGVVFLLFNIGLELSLERLTAMAKFIFGMGSAQMVLTTICIAAAAVACGLTVPQAVVVGMGLAFSSTAVALQVLQDRGESGARHGRATFSVLLFQDLTVVLVFMLVPLLAGPDSGSVSAIAGSLVKAIFKTVVAIGAIMVAGRAVLRPVYNRIAKLKNAEVLTATTLFTALGTSLLTQSLGLSMALGAFLAGLRPPVRPPHARGAQIRRVHRARRRVRVCHLRHRRRRRFAPHGDREPDQPRRRADDGGDASVRDPRGGVQEVLQGGEVRRVAAGEGG